MGLLIITGDTFSLSRDRQKAFNLMLKRFTRSNSEAEKRSQTGAFRQLFEQEESALLRFAILLVGRREIAEEMVQEVFLKLHVNWPEVEQPRAWLYRSLRNRILNHLRDEKLVIRDPTILNSVEQQVGDSSLETVSRLEAINLVRGLLESLPEEDGELLRMKYFEGLRYREISERTGLSVGNVGYRLHHLLKGLAEKLHTLGTD